jgi:uncharacterized protein (TIGR00730 family)
VTEVRRLCVFCGASGGRNPRYVETASAVGAELARRGIELVYGGGRLGLMGAVADGALAGGGRVTGVIPSGLVDRELAHRGVQDLRIVQTLHERKAVMAELSDGFLALPGGLGTLEELAEVLSWPSSSSTQNPSARSMSPATSNPSSRSSTTRPPKGSSVSGTRTC